MKNNFIAKHLYKYNKPPVVEDKRREYIQNAVDKDDDVLYIDDYEADCLCDVGCSGISIAEED